MSGIESGRLTTRRRLLVVTAAIELGAGVTFLVAPAVVVRLLFAPAVDVFPAVGITRLTGAALLAMGAACWWARNEAGSAASRALVGALLIYNSGVVALGLLGTLGGLGPLQGAAVVVHGAQAIWCARVLGDRRG
jgi:hypothetical protein